MIGKTVILSASLVKTITSEARFYEPFPFLRSGPPLTEPGCCGQPDTVQRYTAVDYVKRQVTLMSGSDLVELKRLLKADTIKIVLPTAGGRPETIVL